MPILGITASSITGSTQTSYQSISTVNVSTAVSSITFSSIPATYTHLQIRCIARSSYLNTGYGSIQFNSDTGSNYNAHYVYGNGSAVVASAMGNYTRMDFLALSQSASNTFGAGVIDILDYSNTNKYKTVRSLVGGDDNGGSGGRIALDSGVWMSTSAITSINISSGGGAENFQQYSQFALYGIKGS